jgi:hypothetical protein
VYDGAASTPEMAMRFFLLAVFLLAPACARADATITYDTAGGDCSPEPAGLRVSGTRVRMDLRPVSGSRTSALYDVVEQTMVYLDHTGKTQLLMETDRDATDFQADVSSATMRSMDKEMQKAQAQMEESCRMLEKQGMACPKLPDMAAMMSGNADEIMQQQQDMLANMDPKMLERAGVDVEQAQAQLEEARKQVAGPAGDEREAGTDTVDGHTCRVFEFRDGDTLTDWRCEAEPAALGLGERDARGLAAALRDLVRYGAAFAPIAERFGQKVRRDVPGIVLARRCYEGGKESGHATARIETGALDASLFEIPPGYAPMMEGVR